MTEPSIDDPTLLLHAALDGELDAAGMIVIERQLAADPALAAEYARLVALQGAVRTRLPRARARHRGGAGADPRAKGRAAPRMAL